MNGPAQPDWTTLLRRGVEWLQQGQAAQALAALQQAHHIAPRQRDVRYWLGNALRMNGQRGQARKLFRSLLVERPGDLDASFALAFLHRESGSLTEAAQVMLAAAAQPGVEADRLLQITGFLRDSNQFAAAIEVCRKAVALDPGQADRHFKLARLYLGVGDFGQAGGALRTTLEKDPSMGPAWIALAQQQRFSSAEDPEFRRFEEAAGRSLGTEADMCVAFAYGKALDDLGRWPEAWAQFERGNRLARATQPWDAAAWDGFVEQAVSSEPAEALTGAPRRAVFIVGMPRSGTTLMEQQLARHPRIQGRGELNFLEAFGQERERQQQAGQSLSAEARRQMAEGLWAQLRQGGPESDAYIDKNPLNFRYLDLLFELLPDARVLHLVRDGRASCLSCYFQLFQHPGTAFSYDLGDLAGFYEGYRKLMAAWEARFAGRIHQVAYEDLVSAPEATLADAIRFLGLDPGGAGASAPATAGGPVRSASAWQARQPIHRGSLERWRNYAGQAPGFFERLAGIDSRYA